MAVLEPVCWESKELPFVLKQAVLAPEWPHSHPMSPIYPISSTPNPPSSLPVLKSPDSGFQSPWNRNSPNRSATSSITSSVTSPVTSVGSEQPIESNPNFMSRHLIAAAAPGSGFTLGVIACDKGTMHQLSVPIPEQLLAEPSSPTSSSPIDMTAFTRADINTVTIVGESQLWAGTALGTLHCFEVTSELRLKNHAFININEPILCISSRPTEYVFPSISQPISSIQSSMTTEVLVGLPFGYMIVLAGESDSKGHMKKSVDKLSSRRIIRFTNSPVDCAVNCITHVVSDKDGECYWCGCGRSIFVIRSSDWKKLDQIHPRMESSPKIAIDPGRQEIKDILVTDVGVWSYLTCSSSISLWDRTTYALKLHLNYCNSRRSLPLQTETSCLHYSHPFLFVGTKQGDVIVFKIKEKLTLDSVPLPEGATPEHASSVTTKMDYTFISSTHIGTLPILNILTAAISDSTTRNVLSSVPQTPTSSAINVLVLESTESNNAEEESATGVSRVHVLELCLSPPHSLRSSPLSDITVLSASSLRNNSLTPKKLVVVSSMSDYLPLKNN